jgi:hypothetical protein
MVREHMVRVEHDVWKDYKKACAESKFDAGDLINWILGNLEEDDLADWLKDLESFVIKEEDGLTSAKSDDEDKDELEEVKETKSGSKSESEEESEEDDDEDEDEDDDEEEVEAE